MINSSNKKKIIIEKIKILSTESFKNFEIRIPSNAQKITAITITTNK